MATVAMFGQKVVMLACELLFALDTDFIFAIVA
jgi:hypothetical protein